MKCENKIMGKLKTIVKWIKFAFKTRYYIKFLMLQSKAKPILMLANIEIGKLTINDKSYFRKIDEFNGAMIYMTKSKWYASEGLTNNSKEFWAKSIVEGKEGINLAKKLLNSFKDDSLEPLEYKQIDIYKKEGEIDFVEDVPLVPEINPIVILQGSDFEMGYQYAQQLVQIFGSWILEKKSNRSFSEDQISTIKKWEQQLIEYTPEIIRFCEGWAKGAQDLGITMKYIDVLELWTGSKPPVSFYLGFGERTAEDLPPPWCSGAAAWGKATKDGKLVTGSSGDHDATYTVTIVAYPDSGNKFIITPFGATGDVPMLGGTYFFGHPGMNEKGVAYVHHGGEAKMIEPMGEWGYGIRKGAAVFHILRFANNAQEARHMELKFPVGEAGFSTGTAGGFFADDSYGYVMESRKNPIIVRESGILGESDFLYANNSVQHPDAKAAGWMKYNKELWKWDNHGGWKPKKFVKMKMLGGEPETRLSNAMAFTYQGSHRRNKYLYNVLNQRVGDIDLNYMKCIYKNSGSFPALAWKESKKIYKKTGRWGDISTGHSSNALVAIMKPSEGIYSLCIGPAKRGLTPNSPHWAGINPIHNETNSFWEIKLTPSPYEMLQDAIAKASYDIDNVRAQLNKIDKSHESYTHLYSFMKEAEKEIDIAKKFNREDSISNDLNSIYSLSKSLRAATKAQVKARQIFNLINLA